MWTALVFSDRINGPEERGEVDLKVDKNQQEHFAMRLMKITTM